MAAEHVDQFEPIFEPFVGYGLVVFAGVVNQQIERAAGQEELVSGVIDLLAAEVPDVQAKEASVFQPEFVAVDGDALGGVFLGGQRQGGLVRGQPLT